jgi:hypothetical protein
MRPSLRSTGLRARLRRISIVLSLAAGALIAGPLDRSAKADDGGMMAFLLSGNAASSHRAHYVIDGPRAYYAPPQAARQAKARTHAWRKIARMKAARRHLAKAAATRVNVASVAKTEMFGPFAPPAATIAAKAAAQVASDAHLHDQTLRRGDIIATARGLQIFQGAEHFPYRQTDFLALAKAGKQHNNVILAELDRTIRGHRPVMPAARQPQKRIDLAANASSSVERVSRPLAYAPGVAAAPAPAVRAIERAIGERGPAKVRSVLVRDDVYPATGTNASSGKP